MNSDAFIAGIEAAAVDWIGTPFRANSCTKGDAGGVCCHMLVYAVYLRGGLDIGPVPKGPPRHGRFNRESIMEPWLDRSPHFVRLPGVGDIVPGDLLGYQIGGTIHHLAVALAGGRIVHALDSLGVVVNPQQDPTWSNRLSAVWRPILS